MKTEYPNLVGVFRRIFRTISHHALKKKQTCCYYGDYYELVPDPNAIKNEYAFRVFSLEE